MHGLEENCKEDMDRTDLHGGGQMEVNGNTSLGFLHWNPMILKELKTAFILSREMDDGMILHVHAIGSVTSVNIPQKVIIGRYTK